MVSSYAYAAPEAPVWEKVISGNKAARLFWTEDGDVSGYYVYRSESPDVQTSMKIAALYDDNFQSYYRNSGLTNGITYYYWLKAFDSEDLESSFSNMAQANPRKIIDQDDPARVLIVYDSADIGDDNKNGIADVNEILDYYMEKRGVPDENILGIDDSNITYEWANTYDVFAAPIQEKLNTLSPENIYHIVLINIREKISVDVSPDPRRTMSTQTLAMNVYNLERETAPDGVSNPLYSCISYTPRTFAEPIKRFEHSIYDAEKKFYYLAAHLTDITALSQIESSLYGEQYGGNENYLGGYHIFDSRYGTYSARGDVHDISGPQPYFSLVNYPYEAGYSYEAMDLKTVACVRYFDETSRANYKWHPSHSVVGTEPNDTFEDGSPVGTNIPALSYGGWYGVNYRNVYTWLPGSFYSQVVSYQELAIHARNHGATFVSGPINEPYTNGVIQPAEMVYYAMEGYTYGEAVAYGLPKLNWKNWTSGDPLTCVYRKGKTARLDVTAPPIPQSYYYESTGPNTVELYAYLDTSGRDPDVAWWKLEYGIAPGDYTHGIDYAPLLGYWLHYKFTLAGLTPGSTYYYRISVQDPVGNETTSEERTFELSSTGNRAPYFEFGNHTVNVFEGQSLEFPIPIAYDADGDEITYIARNLPEGAGFDPQRRIFSWEVPWPTDFSYKDVDFIANDGTVTESITIRFQVSDLAENVWVSTGAPGEPDEDKWSLGHVPASDTNFEHETVVFDGDHSNLDCVLTKGEYRQIFMRNSYAGSLSFSMDTSIYSLVADSGTLHASGVHNLTIKSLLKLGPFAGISDGFKENVTIIFGDPLTYTVLIYGNIAAKDIKFVSSSYRRYIVFYIDPNCVLDPENSFGRFGSVNLPNPSWAFLRSMQYGRQYELGDEAQASLMKYMDIKDANALGAGLTVKRSRDLGNNTNITFFSLNSPTISQRTPANQEVLMDINASREFSARVSDADEDLLTVIWRLNGLKVKEEELAVGLFSTYTYQAPSFACRHQLQLIVTNSDGLLTMTVWHIEVEDDINLYIIEASAGANGSIEPTGDIEVSQGNSAAFTITPNPGYHIEDVLVDGVSLGRLTSYTFPDVIRDHTISASFAVNTYTITASAHPGGSIDPVDAVTVVYGQNLTFTITPDDSYYTIRDVLIDDVLPQSVGTDLTYTFSNITSSHSILARFNYTLEVSSNPEHGGSVAKEPGQPVYAYMDNVELTAIPDEPEYIFAGWSDDNVGMSGASPNPRTIKMVKNVAIEAYFIEADITLGDIDDNGLVEVKDAIIAGQYAVGIETPHVYTREFVAANVDNENGITLKDAVMIMRMANEL